MTKTFNIKIPTTIMRLGEERVVHLVRDGLEEELHDDDFKILAKQNSSIRPLIKNIDREDISDLNKLIRDVVERLEDDDLEVVEITANTMRGMCQIKAR